MVYVDDMSAPCRGMVMCHMVADSEAELLTMAGQIGVAAKWHQFPGTWKSNFDICKTKRAMAIRMGAKAISRRELGLSFFRNVSRPALPVLADAQRKTPPEISEGVVIKRWRIGSLK